MESPIVGFAFAGIIAVAAVAVAVVVVIVSVVGVAMRVHRLARFCLPLSAYVNAPW